MTGNNDEFFTPKHKKLERISGTANIFAWIVLAFFALQSISQFLNITSQQSFQSTIDLFRGDPEWAIGFFLNIINILLKGVVYWLILKGVSLGLNMIVESDLNQKEKPQIDDSDDSPISYKPSEVLWVNTWLDRTAIAAVGITVLVSIPEIIRMQQIVLSYFYGNPDWTIVSWLITIVVSGLAIALQCSIIYFSLKALASILKILMEIEFTSRATK